MFEVSTDDNVLARLEKVERDNRTLRRWIVVVVLAITLLFVNTIATTPYPTLRTRRLVIQYPSGARSHYSRDVC